MYFQGQKKRKRKHFKLYLDYKRLENAISMGSCRLSPHWNLQQFHGKLTQPVSRVDYYPCGVLADALAHKCHVCLPPLSPGKSLWCPSACRVPIFPNSLKQKGINPAFLRTLKHPWLPDSNLSALPWWIDQIWRISTSYCFQRQWHFLSQYLTNPLVCLSLFSNIHICCGFHKFFCFVAIPVAAVSVVAGFSP